MLWIIALVWLMLIACTNFASKKLKERRYTKMLKAEQKRRRKEFKALYKVA